MDWRQQSRKLWLHEAYANTRFFYISTNDKRRENQIVKLIVGNQEHAGPQEVAEAYGKSTLPLHMTL